MEKKIFFFSHIFCFFSFFVDPNIIINQGHLKDEVGDVVVELLLSPCSRFDC